MAIFVSRRGLEQRRAAQEDRQFATRVFLEDLTADGTAVWRDPSIQSQVEQVVGTQCGGFVGLAYGLEILIENTKEYLEFDGVTVIRGSTVLLQYPDGDKYTYTILGSNEGDGGNEILSCECEFAKELLGKKKGETFVYNKEKITILSVDRV